VTGPATLAGERDHLLAAIEDLDREWEAGAIDEADYRSLRASYVARAASVIRALEDAPAPPAAAPGPAPPAAAPGRGPRAGGWARLRRKLGRRRSQRRLAIGAAACFLAVAAVFSAHLAGVRLPGQSSSAGGGAASAPIERELREAYVLGSAGKVRAAETLYEQVLAVEPHQPEALAYGGWLLRLLGIATGRHQDVRLGDALVAEAARVDPAYPDARAFFAIALYADRHQPSASVSELRALLADHPRALLVKLVAPLARKAFADAGDPLPAQFGRQG
jgi:hypothetical protein